MRDITRLNPTKITKNGTYLDIDNGTMLQLTDEEIIACRKYFHMDSLASSRILEVERPHETKKVNSTIPPRRTYKATRYQPYKGKHAKKKSGSLKGLMKVLVIGGITLTIIVYGFHLNPFARGSEIEVSTSNHDSGYVGSEPDSIDVQELMNRKVTIQICCEEYGLDPEEIFNKLATLTNNFTSEEYKNGIIIVDDAGNEIHGQSEVELISNYVLYTVYYKNAELSNDSSLEIPAYYEQEKIVKKYCDIYQVNFPIVYSKLLELTNHFQSEDYLNGHISGVTCKGEEVFAKSEEELILYFVRCAKQLPEKLGMSKDNLYVQTGYVSPTDYGRQMGYYGKLLEVDPYLLYSITQSETGWNSKLFIDSNNPAGLMINDDWWRFDTKEEGIIELALEILKYNRLGAYSIEEIGAIHAPEEVDPLNANWIPNVTTIYNEITQFHPEVIPNGENISPNQR